MEALMAQWATIITWLAASVLFTMHRMDTKKHALLKILITAGGAGILYALLSLWDREGASLLITVFFVQAGCVAMDTFFYGKKIIPAQLCLYLCMDVTFLPLYLSEETIWSYAVYPGIFLLCGMIALLNDERSKYTPLSFYDEKKKHFFFLSIFPCSIWIVQIPILIMFRSGSAAGSFILCGVFLFLFGMVLWLQTELIRRLEAEEMNRAINRWQRESRDYMNTIRSQRHDFNLHLHAISGLIASGDYEKCREYVQKLVLDANAVNDIMPVGDAVVGAMLYNMREEARRRGSDIVYDITYDMADILCNGFECNKIIGNLLQNAIDALQNPEDKAYGIKLSIFKRRGNTVIITENRFTGDPNRIARVFEPGYSTKKGHEGIGLSMVLRTVQRYGGRVYPEFDQDVIRFVVNMPNKVNLLKEEAVE